MSGSDLTEQQPELPETQVSDGMAKLTIEAAEVEDIKDIAEDLCKTPTRPENQIRVQDCPPAPRKRRPTLSPTSSHSIKRSLRAQYRFIQDIIMLQEIEAYFRSSAGSSMVIKRRRII